LQHRLKITFVFVTHDQEEALTMSDRIAVINQGKIEQLADATEIYHRPLTPFVAGFIGHANLLTATVSENRLHIDDSLQLRIDQPCVAGTVTISIRPENIRVQKSRPTGENIFEATIEQELFRGPMDQLLLRTPTGLTLTALVVGESLHRGDNVFGQVNPDDIIIVRS
jgi:spermidine/putrescine transport system ATP-binding protein